MGTASDELIGVQSQGQGGEGRSDAPQPELHLWEGDPWGLHGPHTQTHSPIARYSQHRACGAPRPPARCRGAGEMPGPSLQGPLGFPGEAELGGNPGACLEPALEQSPKDGPGL